MIFITPAEANERCEKAPLNNIILQLREKMLKDHDAREGVVNCGEGGDPKLLTSTSTPST